MPNFTKLIQVIDTHTAGEPTRIFLGKIPPLPGSTLLEQFHQAPNVLDGLRKFLMHEPRGHNDLFGAFLIPSTRQDCDFGVIFCHNNGFLKMCGHGSIGIARTLVSLQIIPATQPVTRLRLDTAAGPVELQVNTPSDQEAPGDVVLQNSPAFVYKMGLSLHMPYSMKPISYDIVFGGNFFALVDATQLGLRIEPGNSARLIEYGMLIRKIIKQQQTINHPFFQDLNKVELVEFYEPEEEKNCPARNTVVFGDYQLDRSPCGTGTSAKMALMAEKGLLIPGEQYVSESIIGSRFTGWVEPGPAYDQNRTWVPYIQGKSYITGINQWVAEEGDPFADGFFISRD